MDLSRADVINIYTDGSCSPNPGDGGWAYVTTQGSTRCEASGALRNTTCNRMELLSAINGLKSFGGIEQSVILSTDSKYLQNAFVRGWLEKWKSTQWRKANREPVLNTDLWLQLDMLNAFHNIQWRWVRGHGTNIENNCCDRLAKDARLGLDGTSHR